MARYLVVANRTLLGGRLLEVLRERAGRGGSFHVVVPASPLDGRAWSEGKTRAAAAARLDQGLAHLREAGLEATGEVGDPNPVHAVVDAFLAGHYDGIIVSTLPPRVSRWLRQDVVHRIARAFPHVPLVHVVAERELAAR